MRKSLIISDLVIETKLPHGYNLDGTRNSLKALFGSVVGRIAQ